MRRFISIISTILISFFAIGAYSAPAYAGDLELRAITLNLHNGKDTQGESNIERLAALIQAYSPDLIGLQEVQPHHLKQLAHEDYSWIIGPNANLLTFRFGNALMVRGAILYHRHHYLPGRLEQRGIDEVGVEIGGQQFVVLNTHLGLGRQERQRQLEAIQTIVANTPHPMILLGDFNTSPTDSVFDNLRQHLREAGDEHGPILTFPTSAPRHSIDQIWVNEHFRIESAHPIAWEGSDHLPVLAHVILATSQFGPITIPPETPLGFRSFSSFRQDRRAEIGFGVGRDRDEKDLWAGSISIPIHRQAFVHSVYDDQPITSLGWSSEPFDLRDYLSLTRISGAGQWNILASWSSGYEPWLVWEQNYQWSNHWLSRITIETGGPKAPWEIQQIYAFTEQVSGFVAADADQRYTLGFSIDASPHHQWTIAHQIGTDHSRWLLTWNIR